MTTAAKFIEVAQKEVGTIEGPKNNQTKYGHFTGSDFLPWCGSFVMWCAAQVKLSIPNTVYTPAGVQGFKALHSWYPAETATPQPGDIVYFDFSDGGATVEHVGIVVKDNGNGTVTTIEGNTSPDKKGSQKNGGQVCVKTRAYKKKNGSKLTPSQPVFIVGFGRPKFTK